MKIEHSQRPKSLNLCLFYNSFSVFNIFLHLDKFGGKVIPKSSQKPSKLRFFKLKWSKTRPGDARYPFRILLGVVGQVTSFCMFSGNPAGWLKSIGWGAGGAWAPPGPDLGGQGGGWFILAYARVNGTFSIG